jgi:hypothetical protein
MKFKEMLEMAQNANKETMDEYETKLNAEYKTKMEGATSEMKVKYESELKTKLEEYKKSKMDEDDSVEEDDAEPVAEPVVEGDDAEPVVEAASLTKAMIKTAEDIDKLGTSLFKLMPEIKKTGDAAEMKKFEKVLNKHFDDLTDMIMKQAYEINDD